MKKSFFTALLLLQFFLLYPQNVPQMEFHNQKISDILIILADIGRVTIVPDETVQGNATFYFQEIPFEQALTTFLKAYDLWYIQDEGVYYVSKIHIEVFDDGTLSIDADEINLSTLIKYISKKINKTILFDQLPQGNITLHTVKTPVASVLEMLVRKNWDYELIDDGNYFYIQKLRQQETSVSRFQKTVVKENNGMYSINAPRASFMDIVFQLFKSSKKECSMLMKNSAVLENISYENKEFDQLLRIVLDLGSADYVVKDGIYYIFEVQKKDVMKKLKDTVVVKLRNISVQNAVTLIPSSYDSASLIKVDKGTNTFYITGSEEEIKPLLSFFDIIDKPSDGKIYERFDVHYGSVKDILALIPAEFFSESAVIIPGVNSFIAVVTPESSCKINEYLAMIDREETGCPVRLKYIKSEDLLKYLPPSVTKDEIVLSGDDTLFFYTGTESKRVQFLKNMELIDVPKPQIRYELLVVQYQKSDSLLWNKSFSVAPSKNEKGTSFQGILSNLLNINFDVISQFGYQFALDLNYELGENKAKVLADTTLHGISGTEIKFQNTNTFRYNEGITGSDSSGVVINTTTKEITSGLQLVVNGWVSGDGMITMKVNAEVSKQGTVTGTSSSLPPTSEKVVNSEVRTKSGSPIIIGGLLQTEISETVKRTPFLGYIPLLGRLFQNITKSEETTEMVIYIVPHVYIQEAEPVKISRTIEKYYLNYVMEK